MFLYYFVVYLNLIDSLNTVGLWKKLYSFM